MKKILTFFTLLSIFKLNAQTVNIPDANFLAALISEGVDTNNNGSIQTSEAQAVNSLDVSFKSISDITGIAAFTSLDSLDCSNNTISSIDLSANTSLIYFRCSGNPPLNYLNIASNTNLKYLFCSFTGLTSINVSSNTMLEVFSIINSQCTTLDIRSNSKLTFLHCNSSPNLATVCLTTTQLGYTSSFPGNWVKDASCSWSTSCAVGIEEFSDVKDKKIIHIYNLLGEEVKSVNDNGVYIYQYSNGSTKKIAKLYNY